MFFFLRTIPIIIFFILYFYPKSKVTIHINFYFKV